MDIRIFEEEHEFEIAVRTLARSMATDATKLEPIHLEFLETLAKIHERGLDRDILAQPLELENVTRTIQSPHRRKRLLQLAGIACLINRPVRKDGVEFLEQLATALGVSDPILAVADAVRKGKPGRARLLSVRRMFRTIVKEAYVAEGMAGVIRFFAALFFRWTVNRDKLWSYKRLGLLPDGTFGREYWRHMTEVGFGFPGEFGGIPDTVAYHDLGHVLSGYDTTPPGEIQQGAFQAGCRREDGFVFLQFVTLQFHQGIKITPVAKAETGLFVPSKVLWAVYRGSRCKTDITSQWDYWKVVNQELERVRKDYGLSA